MTDLRYALIIELDRLVSMVPKWELHARLCWDKLQATGDAYDLIKYTEAYWKFMHMRERMEWIVDLLEENPDE